MNGVKITNAGTEIGGPNSLLTINATDMSVRASGTARHYGSRNPTPRLS